MNINKNYEKDTQYCQSEEIPDNFEMPPDPVNHYTVVLKISELTLFNFIRHYPHGQ